jgi:hypothetical protein
MVASVLASVLASVVASVVACAWDEHVVVIEDVDMDVDERDHVVEADCDLQGEEDAMGCA